MLIYEVRLIIVIIKIVNQFISKLINDESVFYDE